MTLINSSIKYSAKIFHEFLPPLNINSFLLSTTGKTEISSIISALVSQKASGLKNIPIKILKLMKNDRSVNAQIITLFHYYLTLIKSLK